MERLREHYEENHEMDTSSYSYCEQNSSSSQNGRLSVLSPNNRQFLEQPRSKSPDMRNKRMIIGQKSFTFGCDGNLIEIPSDDKKLTSGDTADDPNVVALDTGESLEAEDSPVESITFEHRYYFSHDDEKISKQLSFDNTVEFPENDTSLRDDSEETIPNNSNIAQDGTIADVESSEATYNSSDITIRCGERKRRCFDIRRASDGSCNTKSSEKDNAFGDRRRFSDSAVCAVENRRNEYTLLQKRKSFKRQSRVYDTSPLRNCDTNPIASNLPDAILESNNMAEETEIPVIVISTSMRQLNAPKSTENKRDLELEIDTTSNKSRCTPSLSKISETISDRIERFQVSEEDSMPSDHSCTRDNHFCCNKGKVCKSCKYGTNCLDCCCCIDKRKYMKKMKKVMQENKKLEDKLAKSRRQVAQIRGMLSSVMSVRMEPGF